MNTDDQIAQIKLWLGTGSINIFGFPFSGKDTHGHELAKMLNGELIGGGKILRESVIPEHVTRIMETGELVPIDDYINIVVPYLTKPEFKDVPLVLSTVGRWIGEEQGVIAATEKSNHPLKAVIYLQIDPLEVHDRWQKASHERGKRADDARHLLEIRLNEFMTKTLPVIEVYRDLGLLLEIDGRPSIEMVNQNIIDELYKLATK